MPDPETDARLYVPDRKVNPPLTRHVGPGQGFLDWCEDQRRDPQIQRLLAEVYRQQGSLKCCCRTPRPHLYVAWHGRFYRLCRYPMTGHDHAPDCIFCDRDASTSSDAKPPVACGADQVHLKIGRRIEPAQPDTGEARPPRETGQNGITRERQTLLGFFRAFWESAGLHLHQPGLTKNWSVVRAALMDRPETMV